MSELAADGLLFAARYRVSASESASTLMISTLAIAVTVPAMLWISFVPGAVAAAAMC